MNLSSFFPPVAKILGLGGIILIALAIGRYLQFVGAQSQYTRVPAVIREINMSSADTSVQVMTYEYRIGNNTVRKSETGKQVKLMHFAVGDTIPLLVDPENVEEIFYAEGGEYIKSFSIKLGAIGLISLLAGMFLWRWSRHT